MSPYLVVFKQQPLLPLTHALYGDKINMEEACTNEIEQAILYWREVYKEIEHNLRINDKKMTKGYMKRH
jgi:hypothetical protein